MQSYVGNGAALINRINEVMQITDEGIIDLLFRNNLLKNTFRKVLLNHIHIDIGPTRRKINNEPFIFINKFSVRLNFFCIIENNCLHIFN